MKIANKNQGLFLEALSHEFKTPLTGILLNIDNLLNTYMPETEQMQALSAIECQAKCLDDIISKVLFLFTIHQNVKKSNFMALQLLDYVSKEFMGKETDCILDVSCKDFELYGDFELLSKSLLCILENSARASAPGQHIILCAENGTISIRDSGCGIPATAIPYLVEPFFVVESSRNKKLCGVGLGLTFANEVFDVHCAQMTIMSTVGKGTTVQIDFYDKKEKYSMCEKETFQSIQNLDEDIIEEAEQAEFSANNFEHEPLDDVD